MHHTGTKGGEEQLAHKNRRDNRFKLMVLVACVALNAHLFSAFLNFDATRSSQGSEQESRKREPPRTKLHPARTLKNLPLESVVGCYQGLITFDEH